MPARAPSALWAGSAAHARAHRQEPAHAPLPVSVIQQPGKPPSEPRRGHAGGTPMAAGGVWDRGPREGLSLSCCQLGVSIQKFMGLLLWVLSAGTSTPELGGLREVSVTISYLDTEGPTQQINNRKLPEGETQASLIPSPLWKSSCSCSSVGLVEAGLGWAWEETDSALGSGYYTD